MNDDIEARLRRTFDLVAPGPTDVEGGLADLRARLGTAPVPLAGSPRKRSRTALVAAAAAVVIAVTVAVVAAVPGARDDAPTVTTPPAVEATGWYVPEGLDGWEVESVQSDFRDVEGFVGSCPCELWVLVRVELAASIVVARSASTDPNDLGDAFDGGAAVDLGDAVVGRRAPPSAGLEAVAWVDGASHWFVGGAGLEGRGLEDVASALVRAGEPTPAIDGFEVAATAAVPEGLRSYHAVQVVLRTPDGRRVSYVLTPPGFGEVFSFPMVLPAAPTVLPDQPLPMLYMATPDGAVGEVETAFVASWPGADVSANGDSSFGAPVGLATEDEVRTLLAALRPATAEEWAALLASATGDVDESPNLAVARLDDLTGAGG